MSNQQLPAQRLPAHYEPWRDEDVLQLLLTSGLIDDEKTAVDMPLAHASLLQVKASLLDEIPLMMTSSPGLMMSSGGLDDEGGLEGDWRKRRRLLESLDPAKVSAFIQKFFLPAGDDLLPHAPRDFLPEPSGFLPKVSNSKVREFAVAVHQLWPSLCFRTSPSVLRQPWLHSLLPLPYPFFIPGERFREAYYWDSFWVVRGLLASRMVDSALGLVLNLLHLLQNFGFVPNGSRSYYGNRSQPPLLSEMLRCLLPHLPPSLPTPLLHYALPLLMAEHHFWTSAPHLLLIAESSAPSSASSSASRCPPPIHRLSRFFASWTQPRPESHERDRQVVESSLPLPSSAPDAVVSSSGLTAATAADAAFVDGQCPSSSPSSLYREMASVAESGWDFSSRWMRDLHSLSSSCPTQVAPADLNAFVFQLEKNISQFAATLLQAEEEEEAHVGSPAADQSRDATSAAMMLPPVSKTIGAAEAAEISARFHALAESRRASMMALMWQQGIGGGEGGQWVDLWLEDASREFSEEGEQVWRVIPYGQRSPANSTPPPPPSASSSAAAAAEYSNHSMITESAASAAALSSSSSAPPRYASDFVPLWCGLLSPDDSASVDSLIHCFLSSGLFKEGGVAASSLATGEQWDYPNMWPPLAHLLAEGFISAGTDRSRAVGRQIAERFLRSAMRAFDETGAMHEKFDASRVGGVGGGGEYEPQVGFGWTNGVVLSLLESFGWPPEA